MKKEQNPCYGCVPPKRHPACHDSCPERAEWVAKMDVIRKARKKAIADEVAITDYKEFAWKRMRVKERK